MLNLLFFWQTFEVSKLPNSSYLELYENSKSLFSIRKPLSFIRANALSLMFNKILSMPPQPAITCSKLTIGTLEQGVKHV